MLELKKDLTWKKPKLSFAGHKRPCCRACKLHWNSPVLSSFDIEALFLSLSSFGSLSLLQDDSEFRDKITPIAAFMEYSLDYKTAADKTGLLPILDQSTPTNITKQVQRFSSLGLRLQGWFMWADGICGCLMGGVVLGRIIYARKICVLSWLTFIFFF